MNQNTKNFNSTSKEDVDAVNILVKEIMKAIRGNEVKSDHTYQSVIKRTTKKGYVVLDESGNERIAECCIPGIELNVGDHVLVKIPDGDLKQIHIVGIRGKTKPVINATTAVKLGKSTIGSNKNPIYIKDGTATACNATVGGKTKPLYMNKGVLTECNSTVGSDSVPVYMKDGEIMPCGSSTITYSNAEPLGLSLGGTWIDS